MNKVMLVTAVSSIAVLSGCASTGETGANIQKEYEAELNARNQQIEQLKQKLDESQKVAASSRSTSTSASASTETQQATNSSTTFNNNLLPPNAKAGQCFARVYTPPTYRTESESVLKADGYDVVTIIPAVYGTEKQTVMTAEATEALEVIPAVYGWKEEQVLVSPEITELQRVPAKYGFEEEKLLVKPAHSIWKKGTGPITKVNQSTGEIMCLVEVPAVYETVKKRVLLTPETTKLVVVKAAVYKTVKTRVVEQPARTVSKEIPAKYDTVAVKKLLKESTTTSVSVPPVYETVKTTINVADGFLEWTPILCETNVTGDIIRQLQQSLNDKNYNAGPVDGVYGWQTTAAVRKYQRDNKMPGDGQLTIALVESLNLKY